MTLFEIMNMPVKRMTAALLFGLTSALAASGQTSVYSQVNVAGSFNGFETLNSNMVLVANNLWQADLEITNATFFFKFATPNFAQNWGINGQPHTSLPQAMTGISGADDIHVNNSSDNYLYRFLFNDSTREYAVFLINNIDTNLLFNTSFENSGSSSTLARYWEFGNPNPHGGNGGTAERQNWGSPNSGAWVGLMKGTWAGQGESGFWWQEAPIEAGITYEASAWFQAEGAPNQWTASTQILKIEFFDYNRFTLLASYERNLTGLSTNWSQQNISGIAPAGAYWARLVIYVDGAGNAGTLRIDDATLRATIAKRAEDFNDWNGATIDNCYTRGGWTVCTGKAVSTYVYETEIVPLARSSFAASLANPSGTTNSSFIQSPRLNSGIGTVTFHYRHGYQGDPSEGPDQPVRLLVQLSTLGDFWETVSVVSNIFNTSYNRFDLFLNQPTRRYVRIVHDGGSTNRLIIDDISIALPVDQSRIMNFDTWTNAITPDCYSFDTWLVCTGFVSSGIAKQGLGAQILGSSNDGNYFRSPLFTNGYGQISFSYRRGINSTRTVGLSLEASPDGSDWTVLDTITNISSISWIDYSRFFYRNTPHYIRIRNISETNIALNATEFINEAFDDGSTPPPDWEFSQISQYDSTASSGENPPSLSFNQNGSYVITPSIANPTNARFMTKGNSISTESSFVVEGMVFGDWQTLVVYSNMNNDKITRNLTLSTNVTQLRFTYNKIAGNLAFDDLLVTGHGVSGPAQPQNLALDNVGIGLPVEHRLQTFDTWPTKPSFDSGVTQHQNWALSGLAIVDSAKALSGQAARLARVSGGGGGGVEYIIDFEGQNETKGTYASGDVTLSGISWNLNEVLIGTLVNDWKIGARSARLRANNGAVMSMNANKSGGLGAISFGYRRYGTDGSQQPWAVEYSTNNGSVWTQIGSTITATDSQQTFNEVVNVPGDVRVRIRLASTPGTGSTTRRMNIDNIVMTAASEEEEEEDDETLNPSITSHFFPDGIGPISFHYRHFLDTTPNDGAVLTALIQTSPDYVNWHTVDTQLISNTSYQLYDGYQVITNHYYARIIITKGNGQALFDNVEVRRPQAPAFVNLTGSITPSAPYTNETVFFNAQAIAQLGAVSITVTTYYRIGTSGAYTAIGMNPLGGNQFVSASGVPPQPSGTIVQYYMEAWYNGPGASLTRPAYYPTNAPGTPAYYGIPRAAPGRVWINEVDYVANILGFEGEEHLEFIELAGYAGSDLSGWSIELVNGQTTLLPIVGHYVITNHVLSNSASGFGFYLFGGADMINKNQTITNILESMIPGGIRLYNELGGLEDSLSYGGIMPGFEYVGVNDVDDPFDWDWPGSTSTVSRIGVGVGADDFTWANAAPTPGAINDGQTFANPGLIQSSPVSLVFNYIPGSFSPANQLIVVSNIGAFEMSYTISPSAGWLNVNPAAANNLATNSSVTHTVTVSTDGLSGNHSASLTIVGNAGNSPYVIPVQLIATTPGAPLLYYALDDGGGSLAFNQGSIGINGNLFLADGADWTLEAQGASGALGDFAYVSLTNTAHAATTGTVSGLNNLNKFTITGWLKPLGTGGVHRILGNHASTAGFNIDTTIDYQNLTFVTAGGSAITSTNGSMPSNVWTFVAITFDSTNSAVDALKFYRGTANNGIFLSSSHANGSLGATGISTNRLFMGGNGMTSYHGYLDDMRVFGDILNPMEIESIRQAGSTRGTGSGSTPFITSQPENQTVPSGQSASFSVVADGEPLPQYQWRKDGVNLTGQSSFNLFISDTSLSDVGAYDVVVFNAAGSVTSTLVYLTLDNTISITSQPSSITVYVGEAATFTVGALATGTNIPTYQWRFYSTNILAATNASLTLTNIQLNQAGNYTVVVSDPSGTLTSVVATLTVEYLEFFGENGGFQRVGTNMVLRWPGLSNRTYDLLWSTNLMSGYQGFILIATNLPATPAVNVYTDTVYGAQTKGFYQIKVNQTQ